MNSLLAFATFTVLCNHNLYIVSKHFHHSKRKIPKPVKQLLPVPLSLQPLANTHLFPTSMDLPSLGISCKWDHTVCYLLYLLLSLSITFSRSVCVVACISTSFLSMTEWYSIVWIYHTCLSIHQLIGVLVVFTFWLLWLAPMNADIQVFV